MKTKQWVGQAKDLLHTSFNPIPHELNELDWKLSLSENKGNLVRHLSAFSNQKGGGYFVFGLTSNGEPVGVPIDETDQIIRKLANIARDGLDPPQKIDHFIDQITDKNLLFIHVLESSQKPVHIRGKSIEFSFIRSGGQTRRMSHQEIANAILNSRHTRYEELEALPCAPSDIKELLDYETLFKLLNIPIPDSQDLLIEQLVNQKIIYRNNGHCSITNLGALLAARDLKSFPGKERFGVRVIKYRGTGKLETEVEKEFTQGYGVVFQSLVRHVLDQLPTGEIIQDALRKNVPLYPEITIRELIANALIHRLSKALDNLCYPKLNIMPSCC